MDRKWCSEQRRPGGRQLPYSETVLYAERRKVVSEQGRDRGLQEKRRGQSPVQIQCDSVAATLSNRAFIQVARSDGPSGNRRGTDKPGEQGTDKPGEQGTDKRGTDKPGNRRGIDCSTGNRQTSNERPTQGTHATGRSDSGNRGHASPRSHVGQAGNTHGDSDCRDAPHTEPLTRCEDIHAGHSRDATAMATAFEPLNRSLETFLTRLSRTNERSEKSRSVFKKPRCYKDESDGCIDTWIEVMKPHFEEEDLSERQECSALTSNLEGTALNCVMAKKQYQRDTAEKIFEILLNRFWLRGARTPSHDALRETEATGR